MKNSKNFLSSVTFASLLIVGAVTCYKVLISVNHVDQEISFLVDTTEQQVRQILNAFFLEAGQSLVTGKQPVLTMCSTEDNICKDVLHRKYSRPDYLLKSYTGKVSDLYIEIADETIKAKFNYYATLTYSEEELATYSGLDTFYEDRDFYEVSLQKKGGILKIVSIKLYTDADVYYPPIAEMKSTAATPE